MIYNLISFCGIFILVFIAWVLSENRKKINYKTVFGGIGLQFIIAGFVFLFPAGTKLFLILNNIFLEILNSSTEGAKFLFGPLALAPGSGGAGGQTSIGFILAFQVFPVIIFFSSFMSLLYYFNIIPRLINFLSKIFSRFLQISGAEALCVTSNIFVGIESVFTIRPYLTRMTSSEFLVVLTAGMATVSSSVLGLYVFTLNDIFPNIAAHLISASILSAPAAIVISKILIPETKQSETMNKEAKLFYEKEENLIEAIIEGAANGTKMVVGIAALLIALLGLVQLVNIILVFSGDNLNTLFNTNLNLSLQNLLAYLFYPLTLILGVPLVDAMEVSKIIGERVILTEVVSYQDLAVSLKNGAITNHRSSVITVYALCGFAHVASMAIFVGGTIALVPDRRSDIAKLGVKALIASTLACLITASFAGLFYNQQFANNIIF